MDRILAENEAPRERRDHLTYAQYQMPELLSTAPHQLWSGDIIKLRGGPSFPRTNRPVKVLRKTIYQRSHVGDCKQFI
jgi:hypothetical protein